MRHDVAIKAPGGRWMELPLAVDSQDGRKLFDVKTTDPVRPTVQIGEATYDAMIPQISSTYAQPDLSGGIGKATQVVQSHRRFGAYRHAEWADASVAGWIQKGPKVATLEAPADAGTLESLFELGGVPYLVLGRKIAGYAAGALTEAEDLGAGKAGYGSAVFPKLAAAASDQASTGTGATSVVDGPEKMLSQSFKLGATKYLSKVVAKLARTDVSSVQTITISGTPTGGTFPLSYGGLATAGLAYNVSAADMQTALRALAGLSAVTVGKVGWIYTITFAGVIGAALLLSADPSGLTGGTPSITVTITRQGYTLGSVVEMAAQTDRDGKPSGTDLAVASLQPQAIATAATDATFDLSSGDHVLLAADETYHLVLRCLGTAPTAYVSWTRGAATSYADGDAASTGDNGESWTAIGSNVDFNFAVWTQDYTETAYVGQPSGDPIKSTTDGATYASEAAQGKHLAIYNDLLVRDTQVDAVGAVQWSSDGANWSEPVPVGDETVPVTAILALSGTLIVATEDGIWAIDPDASPIVLTPLYRSGASATNGQGACVWQNKAYIPFGGRLMAAWGDASNGFQVRRSIGPETLPEWHAPWGSGCYVAAVAGDRWHLYAAYYTATGYKLLKNADPTTSPGEGWHGSLADLGSPTTLHSMAVWDAGGSPNPILFVSTDSYDVGRIVLPRTANPAADVAYLYDTANDGEVHYPTAHCNFYVSLKAWLAESVTFIEEVSGGYAQMLYDTSDGQGWRLLGQLHRTGTLDYPDEARSRLLDRKLVIRNSSETASPIILCSAVTAALLVSKLSFSLTILVDAAMNSNELGDRLPWTAKELTLALRGLPGLGKCRMRDPDGLEYRVLFLSASEKLLQIGSDGNRKLVTLEAVAA